MSLCETFLHGEITDSSLLINNFNFERRVRLNKKGGGVCIDRHDLEIDTVETICIELKIHGYTPLVLTFVYRPPDSKVVSLSNFERSLDTIDGFNYDIHFLGDFNVNYSPNNVHKPFINNRWCDIVSKFGIKQLITQPTRITKSSETIIGQSFFIQIE